jgi:hypothetical protein
MAKHQEGVTVGAIEEGLSDAVLGKKKKRTRRSVFDSALREIDELTFAMGTESGKRIVQRSKLAKRVKLGAVVVDARSKRVANDRADLNTRRTEAIELAQRHGHRLGTWHKRKGDRYGREDARCLDCDDSVTVCSETPREYGLPLVYGDAVTRQCALQVQS